MFERLDNLPIGVFDSGVGGLTVLKEIHKLLPLESTLYLGDTARVPYGIRSSGTVVRYSLENSDFLIHKGIKLLIIACNTASSVALEMIRDSVSIPVIGVIEPGAEASVKCTRIRRIGVIGTEATIKSKAYGKAIHKIDSSISIYEEACPLFVPLVEEGWLEDEITGMVIERYLDGMKKNNIDTLVLGCTHYPLLKKSIQEVMGKGITLIDSAVETATVAKKILSNSGVLNYDNRGKVRKYYVTDSSERFSRIGERFNFESINNVETVKLKTLEVEVG